MAWEDDRLDVNDETRGNGHFCLSLNFCLRREPASNETSPWRNDVIWMIHVKLPYSHPVAFAVHHVPRLDRRQVHERTVRVCCSVRVLRGGYPVIVPCRVDEPDDGSISRRSAVAGSKVKIASVLFRQWVFDYWMRVILGGYGYESRMSSQFRPIGNCGVRSAKSEVHTYISVILSSFSSRSGPRSSNKS